MQSIVYYFKGILYVLLKLSIYKISNIYYHFVIKTHNKIHFQMINHNFHLFQPEKNTFVT